jgi:hypothetical protein
MGLETILLLGSEYAAENATWGHRDPSRRRFRKPRKMTRKSCQVFFSVLSRSLLNSTAVDRWADYVLNEGDEFVPSMWVKPRRLMLRIGLEY